MEKNHGFLWVGRFVVAFLSFAFVYESLAVQLWGLFAIIVLLAVGVVLSPVPGTHFVTIVVPYAFLISAMVIAQIADLVILWVFIFASVTSGIAAVVNYLHMERSRNTMEVSYLTWAFASFLVTALLVWAAASPQPTAYAIIDGIENASLGAAIFLYFLLIQPLHVLALKSHG